MVHSLTYFFAYLFTIICAVAGGALLAAAVVVGIWHGDQPEVFENVTTLWPIITAAILGAIVVIINVMGCFGTASKSVYMIYAHPTIMLVLTLLLAALGVVVFVRSDFVEMQTIDTLSEKWNVTHNTGFVNYVQSSMRCCGLNSSDEWTNVPTSCCPRTTMACHRGIVFDLTCISAFEELVRISIIVLGATLFTTAGIHIIGLIVLLVLAASFNSARNKVTV